MLRFLSEDRLGINGWLVNHYRYVDGNPIRYVDPSGRVAKTPCGDIPRQTTNCAADCIAKYRWARCAMEQVLSAAEEAHVIKALGSAAVQRACTGEGGEEHLVEGALEVASTAPAHSLSDNRLDQFVMDCIQFCAAGDKCGVTPSDFFGGCGTPVNKTATPRAFR